MAKTAEQLQDETNFKTALESLAAAIGITIVFPLQEGQRKILTEVTAEYLMTNPANSSEVVLWSLLAEKYFDIITWKYKDSAVYGDLGNA